METEKGLRLLYLYEALVRGDGIRKKEAAERFGGDEKSIQRDIEVLKNYFAEQTPPMEIQYIPKEHCHRLVSSEQSYLTCGEVLAVCQILLESRSLPQKEMDGIIDKLLSACVSPKSEKAIKKSIGNERLHYIEPHHGKALTDRLWKLGQAIESHSVLRVTYHTQTGQVKQRILQPVGLMFSEFYFYLTAFIEEIDKEAHFEDANDLFPTIYRVDRIKKLEVLNRHFQVPYSQRFSEGEFRKRVQFMYGGKLQTVRFIYRGPSVEAVLDRLPTAEILNEKDGEYEIRAEVFGKGIEMWLRSQGDYIKTV